MRQPKLLILGNFDPFHLGSHLLDAANDLGLETTTLDLRIAESPSRWKNRFSWHFRQRRLPNAARFEGKVIEMVRRTLPSAVIVTGMCSLTRETIQSLNAKGCKTINYLTDDPWNPLFTSHWALEALKDYSALFSPREANLDQLQALAPQRVHYLPFGFAPKAHYPIKIKTPQDQARFGCDVMFAGGADKDRLPWIEALIDLGVDVKLYGNYWGRFASTRAYYRGHLPMEELRGAIAHSKICLNLVRQANRDDNVMRTFELPAMGACTVSQATPMQRKLFTNNAIRFFDTEAELLNQVQFLLKNPLERIALAQNAITEVHAGNHEYKHRLQTILQTVGLYPHFSRSAAHADSPKVTKQMESI